MASYERVLLTGGTGFVGPYVLDALTRAYPSAARRLLVRPGESNPRGDWTPVVADLTDSSAIEKAVEEVRPDLVVHLAAQASVAQAIGGAETTWRVNFLGSFNLAAAVARHAPAATVFFVSSGEVYGASLRSGMANEDTPPRPSNPYARSKLAAEAMLGDILPQESRLIIARPFNHLGPGQDQRFALPSFAAQIAAIEGGRRPPRVEVGNLSVERDFLDVRDVVEAYVRLLEAAPGLGPRNVFNVASGTSRSLASLLESLRRHSTRDFDIAVDPERLRPADVPRAVGDISRLRELTSWRPRHSIDESLVSLLNHWRAVECGSLTSSGRDAAR